ncbi:PREDICTED: uncharacterized protein LOC108564356 [Nicrophorus vespilloides]|uniref:Uncharacterized protein LOC108564356 n=1 Tax=Nicrophorus vespilloides TaxID=110193 RepID=A0ABM1MWB6_NICVS|nr:PREDICTED: uncharacterized protein LOC108564356 [Nicrophorus vespilloides]
MKDLTFDSLDTLIKQTDDLYLEICGLQTPSMYFTESPSTYSIESKSTNSIDSKSTYSMESPPKYYEELSPPNSPKFSFTDKYAKLGRATALQSKLLGQSKKALRFCRNNLSVIGGEQEREAIRVSLLTKLKLEAIRKEIYRDVTDVNHGATTIKNLMFSVVGRKGTYLSLNKTFYLCIFSCEDQVFGTQWTEVTSSNFMVFQEHISFESIESNFEIILSVYSLTVPRTNKQLKPIVNLISKPKLQMEGQIVLTTANFQKIGKYEMKIINRDSDLDGKFTMDFKGRLSIQEHLANYVNYGIRIGKDEFGGRFWCVLGKQGLQFFDQSSEQKLFLCFQNIVGTIKQNVVINSIAWESIDGVDRVSNVLQFNNEDIMKHWMMRLNSLLLLYRQYYC